MNSTLAKLIALQDRVASVQELHSTPPEDIFVSLRDQFLKEADKLKKEFPDLQDFAPQNYEQFHAGDASYHKWATRALIADIQYFIKFLNSVETIQTPNIKVSEEGVYFAGQHFDALLKFNDIIAKATKEIILIDNYLNEKILELLASKNNSVLCRVLTLNKSITPTIKTFIEAFNKQHKNLEVKTSSVFHDRFVVLDQTDFYHFGASIKDAGNKGFMFSKIDQGFIKDGLLLQFEKEWKK
ncbi:MAG: hypothetical protein FVQ77_02435 [Cytophagales bacterium]|nr:hypothetical protein [Cytophagales bacterium]